jgi:hypothetical protein
MDFSRPRRETNKIGMEAFKSGNFVSETSSLSLNNSGGDLCDLDEAVSKKKKKTKENKTHFDSGSFVHEIAQRILNRLLITVDLSWT